MLFDFFYIWEIEIAKEFEVDPGLIRYLYGVAKHNYICSSYYRSIYFEGGELTEYSKQIVVAAEESIERNK